MGVQTGDEVKLAPLAQEDPSTGGNPLEMTEEKFQEQLRTVFQVNIKIYNFKNCLRALAKLLLHRR